MIIRVTRVTNCKKGRDPESVLESLLNITLLSSNVIKYTEYMYVWSCINYNALELDGHDETVLQSGTF